MAIITIPVGVRIAALEWQQPPTYAFNRSELTGKSRAIQLGPATRWSASGRLVPVKGADAKAVKAYLALMSQPGNLCRLRMVEASQVTVGGRPTSATVNGAGQLGLTLALSGLQASVTNLVAGDVISIVMASEDSQPIILGADLVANGSGQATAVLTTPLRKSPANAAAVELQWPTATMRMRNSLAWKVSPAPVYESEVAFEEAF
jgi:hypothetical protein